MKPTRVRVALVGLGPIGIEVGKALAARDDVTLLGAADPAPDKAGSLASLLDGAFPGVSVTDSAAALYQASASSRGRGDVAVLCTGCASTRCCPRSRKPRGRSCTRVDLRGARVPELRHSPMARHRSEAKEKGGRSSARASIPARDGVWSRGGGGVRARRFRQGHPRRGAAKRRGPLRAKVGAGLTRQEFADGVAARKSATSASPSRRP